MSQNTDKDRPSAQKRQMFDQDATPGGRPAPGGRGIPPANAGTAGKGQGKAQSAAKGTAQKPAKAGASPVKKAQKRSKKKIAAVVALTIVVVLVVGVFSIYTILANQIDGENTMAGKLPDDVKTLPEYTGKGIVNILVCGLDYDNDTADGYSDEADHVGRTDMIMYMTYDTVNNKVSFLQIPRDTYVGDELETGDTGKINGLYYFSEDPDNRMAPLARAINDQLGLPVDYYITIDMDAVKEIIDIKGSITVYVPVDVIDPENPEAMIPAGWREFSSAEAEFFLRNRTSPTYQQQGDIMRLQMQQSFYSALYREFKTLAPSDLLMWMEVLLWRCHTDMDAVQLGGLAQKALNLESDDIVFVRPPVSGASLGNVSLVSLVPGETADLLNQYFRPEGRTLTVEELNIYTLPVVESIGISEASVRTMGDVQAGEPPAA